MIYTHTYLESIDNSGAIIVQCIKILKNKKIGYLGDKIIIITKKVNSKKKLKKSIKLLAIIVQIKKNTIRSSGNYIKFGNNKVIILNNKKKLLGNRIKGVISIEIRRHNLGRIMLLAQNIF
jgi:large subunit ribosomal protein L14